MNIAQSAETTERHGSTGLVISSVPHRDENGSNQQSISVNPVQEPTPRPL